VCPSPSLLLNAYLPPSRKRLPYSGLEFGLLLHAEPPHPSLFTWKHDLFSFSLSICSPLLHLTVIVKFLRTTPLVCHTDPPGIRPAVPFPLRPRRGCGFLIQKEPIPFFLSQSLSGSWTSSLPFKLPASPCPPPTT